MSYSRKYKGKYVDIDSDNPQTVGVCDRTGFVFNHKDLVKQMQWSGNSIVWTGLWVGKPFLDVLNEQNRPPITKVDPEVVKDPKPPKAAPEALPYKAIDEELNKHKWGNN